MGRIGVDRFYTNDPRLKVVLAWLFAVGDCDPVAAEWVPGTTPSERMRLAALGGLVRSLVEDASAHPAFAAPELRVWLASGPTPPEDVIATARKVLAEDQEDGLARIYAKVVSGKSRRTLGTFFTPSHEVRWMLDHWRENHEDPDAVVDVGAGVGIFTTSAAHAWPRAAVWAVDINPITLGLLALRVHDDFTLVESADDRSTPGLRIAHADFTRWMNVGWEKLKGRRLILGNPPYTRLQLLPLDQRERLTDAAGGLCGNRASLSALITAMSLNALEPDDGLSLLLPAQWLESDYARALRSRLWTMTDRRVEMRIFDQGLFDDATVDAVALMVGPAMGEAQPIVFSTGTAAPREIADRTDCPREWRSLFKRKPSGASQPRSVLGDYVKVRRGVATGANAFFALTAEQAAAAQLPTAVTQPLIRRLLDLPDQVTSEVLAELPDDARYVLLTVTQETFAKASEYLGSEEAELVQLRHLCQQRERQAGWYDLSVEITHPDLVIGQSTKRDFRIVENQARAVILNNLYGMTWLPGVDESTQAGVLAWLRSNKGQAALRRAARVQGTGLYKIEPKALMRLPMPAEFTPPQATLD